MEFVTSRWLCWAIILISWFGLSVLWQQLQRWKRWKDKMRKWLKRHYDWERDNCACPQPDPEDPPTPPTWPNGGWLE